eukprot:SAG11_NODE_1782_length_4261_cov_2.796732_5_plen_89_part_00
MAHTHHIATSLYTFYIEFRIRAGRTAVRNFVALLVERDLLAILRTARDVHLDRLLRVLPAADNTFLTPVLRNQAHPPTPRVTTNRMRP